MAGLWRKQLINEWESSQNVHSFNLTERPQISAVHDSVAQDVMRFNLEADELQQEKTISGSIMVS